MRLARRAGRYERYRQVMERHEQGMKPKLIAQRLEMSERTTQKWIAAKAFPETKRHNCSDAFAPYVLKRWQDGEKHGAYLVHELIEQGYTGLVRTVYRYLEVLKQTEVKAAASLHRLHKFSAHAAVWLFVCDVPKVLDEIEQEYLTAFCQGSTTLKRAYSLVQDFLYMVRNEKEIVWIRGLLRSLPVIFPNFNPLLRE